ncbi:MAG: DUF2520 domain-containing protein [Bacteroidetes bacterium]|nr:MAG: DUF2520 domain-containing protein [Bacteroidota bacterium]
MDICLPETFSVLGAGNVATALSKALAQKGIRPLIVASRTLESAENLAAHLDGANAVSLSDLLESNDLPGDLVVFSVSDDALLQVAEAIAEKVARPMDDWADRLVIHTSGTWTSDVLAPFEVAGALTASFHPLQTFTDRDPETADPTRFSGLPIGIEGGEQAVEAASAVAQTLGAAPFTLSASTKGLFHAAAVMASNYLVTLQAMAQELSEAALGENGPASDRYRALFGTLTRQALSNALELGPEDALTGPIVRGDVRVLREHLHQIQGRAPHLIPVYTSLATESIRLASESGRVTDELAEAMLELLTEFLSSDSQDDTMD